MPGSTSTMRIYSVRSVSCQGSEAETAAQQDAADESQPQSRLLRALLEARLVRGRYGRTRLVTLLADLEDFVHDHRQHGPLAGDATECLHFQLCAISNHLPRGGVGTGWLGLR